MKTLRILETMWFIIATVSVSAGVFILVTQSPAEAANFFIISLLAFAFGYVKRRQRLNGEKKKNEAIEN